MRLSYEVDLLLTTRLLGPESTSKSEEVTLMRPIHGNLV